MKTIVNFKKQKGIALPIALLVLVGILIAAANLIRSGELAVNVSGNISNRASVGNSNDAAIRTATQWLSDNQAALNNDDVGSGYRSAYPVGTVDYTQDSAWANAKTLPADSLGNISSYKIIRMCEQPNTSYNGSNAGAQNVCAQTNSGGTGNTNTTSSVGYDAVSFEGTSGIKVFYQVYVKTVGSKGAKVITLTTVNVPV
jgi:Tfp pilus assembly protein PilX